MSDSRNVDIDLNNPVFQRMLFQLQKEQQLSVLNTLSKLSKMTWDQLYQDKGLKWEAIYSKQGPKNERVYTFRITQAFRCIAYREKNWLRLLTLHPSHDTAYRH